MSILNHFGKVKASYKKYESELPHYKGFVFDIISKNNGMPNNCCYLHKLSFSKPDGSGGKMYCNGGLFEHDGKYIKDISFIDTYYSWGNTEHSFNLKPQPIGNGHLTEDKSVLISDTYYSSMSPELYVFSFTNLVETFSKCLEKVREKLSSELWKTIEYCPLITIIDLLLLKHSDTDKHIEHLEEIIKSLIDDNKLLQTKINSLESQMSLFKSKIPIAVAVSECSEKTIAEEILNE